MISPVIVIIYDYRLSGFVFLLEISHIIYFISHIYEVFQTSVYTSQHFFEHFQSVRDNKNQKNQLENKEYKRLHTYYIHGISQSEPKLHLRTTLTIKAMTL